jgi:hypothetical protein
MALISKERAAGETPRSAYLSALVSALASKNFYQLHEGTPDEDRKHLTAWELISRLSYFLWSSMPDERLFGTARDGSILKPSVLRGGCSCIAWAHFHRIQSFTRNMIAGSSRAWWKNRNDFSGKF